MNIGWVLHILLTGVTIPVYYRYRNSSASENDTIYTTLLIWFAFISNLASAGVGWTELFERQATQQASLPELVHFTVADCVAQLPQAFVVLTVQSLFAERIARVSESLLRHESMSLTIRRCRS